MRQTEPLPGFALKGPLCGAQMRIIAFITDPPILCEILHHVGEPTAHRARPRPAAPGSARCRDR